MLNMFYLLGSVKKIGGVHNLGEEGCHLILNIEVKSEDKIQQNIFRVDVYGDMSITIKNHLKIDDFIAVKGHLDNIPHKYAMIGTSLIADKITFLSEKSDEDKKY